MSYADWVKKRKEEEEKKKPKAEARETAPSANRSGDATSGRNENDGRGKAKSYSEWTKMRGGTGGTKKGEGEYTIGRNGSVVVSRASDGLDGLYSLLDEANGRVTSAKKDIDNYFSSHGSTADDFADEVAKRYGAQWNGNDGYVFDTQGSLDEFNRIMNELSALYDSYNSEVASYNRLYDHLQNNSEYKEQQRLLGYDLEAAQKQLDDLSTRLEKAKKDRDLMVMTMGRADRHGTAEVLELNSKMLAEKEAIYKELSEQVAALNRDIYNATHYQDSAKYYSYMDAEDFDQYASTDTPAIRDIEYLSEDELRIYNYLMAKEGWPAARDYMEHLQEAINYRKGTERGEDIRGIENDLGRFLATTGHSAWSGLANFGRGIEQLFTDEMLATSATQYADKYILEDLAKSGWEVPGTDKTLGELGYEGLSTVTNMAPSVLVGYATAGLGASAGVASAAASASMGLSAAGNAYTQALGDGYTKEQARNYATAVGASEAALQYVLGGISKMAAPGGASAKMLAKAQGIKNGGLRAAAAWGIKGGSEIAEEELQNYLEPLYRKVIFDEEYDAPTAEEIAYTAVLTFLTTGVMEAGDIISFAANKPPSIGQTMRDPGALPETLEQAALEATSTYTREGYEQAQNNVAAAENALAEARRNGADQATISSLESNVRVAEKKLGYIGAEKPTAQPVSEVRRMADTAEGASRNAVREAVNSEYGEYGTRALAELTAEHGSEEGVRKSFDTPYKLGRMNTPRESLQLNNEVQRIAYDAGRKDAIMAGDFGLENTDTQEYNGNTRMEDTANEEVRLRNSSQWSGSTNPVGQVPGMAESAGGNQVRQAQGQPADSGATSLSYGKRVSTASFGIAGGSRKKTVRLITSPDTPSMAAARQNAKERGLRVVFFAGNNLDIAQTVTDKNGKLKKVDISARAFISGDRVFVRVDHPKYTADQIMRHEIGHDMIAKGEIDPKTVRDRIDKKFGKDKSQKLADMYNEAYEGAGMTADEIWEEVICDSLGDMNIFSETASESEAWELLSETKASSADAKAETVRGPPAKDGKMSQERPYVDISRQEWRQIQSARMSKYSGNFDAMPRMDCVNAHNMLYVIENFDVDHFGTVDVIDPGKNQAKANIVMEVMKDGDIEYASDYRRRTENLRRWQRRNDSHSVHVKNAETRKGDAGAYAQNEKAGNRGAVAEESGRDNEVDTYSPDYAYWRNAVKDNGKASRELPSEGHGLDKIKAAYKDKTDHLYLHERNDTISVDNIVVKKEYRNRGVGTQILNDVIDYADSSGKTVTLTPTSEFGTKARLTKWYKAHGFVENKGKNADYRLSDTMYRLPRHKFSRELDVEMKDSTGADLTKEQAEYFKNSQIRDENGNLRRVYHGTYSKDFTVFDWAETGRADGGWFGRGFYFTFYKGEARMYGTRVIDAYLNIEKPFVFDEELLRYDGEKVDGVQADSLAFMINFAEKFPGLAKERTLTVVTGWDDQGYGKVKNIPWSELRGEVEKVLENETFKPVEFEDYYDGNYFSYQMKNGPGKYDYVHNRMQYSTLEEANKHRFDAAAEMLFSGIYKHAEIHMPHTYIEDIGTEFSKELQKRGYDGVLQTRRGDEVVAFRPEQIKSADNKKPTSDPDIRFSRELDVQYLDAVAKDDTKTAQKMVDEAANKAMPNSKIRDKKGNLIPVYHGTNDTFFEFNPLFKGGTNGTAEGYGIYTSDNPEVTEAYGDRQLKMYANITKPARSDKKTITAKTLTALIKDTCLKQAMDMVAEGDYDSEKDALFDTWISNYVYTYDLGMERSYREAAAEILRINDSDMAVIQEVMSGLGIRDYSAAMEFYDLSLTPVTGFDGFVTQWDNANTGKKPNIILAFNSNQLKSADPVTWDSNGDIIPLSERFNPDNKDIRFSRELDSIEQLRKSNEKLRETNDALREQFQTTKFAKVDRKSLDKFAKKLLKDYQSGADIDETRDALDKLYTYLANGENGESPVWQEAYKRAYDTAVEILEQSGDLDDWMYQQYKALRDELRTRGVSLSKEYDGDLVGYESINEFRKAHIGSIKMTNEGTPVDVVYADLADRYPEFFNADEYTNPADQLLHIAEVLDSLRPVEVNPYSANMRQSATWLANDIMERFFELPQAKATFADKAQQKLTKQIIHDAKKLEKLRTEKNERIAQVIKRERQRAGEVRKQEREKRSKAVQQVKEYYLGKQAAGSERRNSATLRKRIAKHASDLSKKLLNPTDKQHIPQDLRDTVAAVLEAINLESQYTIDPVTGKRQKNGGGDPTKRTEAFRKLKEAYSKILQMEGGDMVIDPSLLGDAAEGFEGYFDIVLGMGDTKLADMSLDQLEIVWRVLRAVEKSVTTAGKMLASKKFESTVEWAEAFEQDTDTRRRLKGSKTEAFRLDLENPFTFFSHYGKAGVAVFRMLRDAQDAQQDMVETVNAEVRKIVNSKQVKAWEKEVHEFKTARGEKLFLTVAHMMEIHELMKREQARDHLTKGGIVQPEIKGKKVNRGTDAILLSLEDIMQIVGKLTKEQIEVADKLQSLTTGILAQYGNEASMRAYGYEKFTGTDYWPIKSAREGVHSNIEKGGSNSRSIKNIGLAKAVMPHASNALDIGGIFQTFAGHTADMTDYAAWLCPMEDANRLYNFKFRDEMGQQSGMTMKGLLDRYGGKNAQKYWHNLMEDIQNGISASNDTAVMNWLNKAIGNARAASVGANIRVIVQQPTAIIRAAMVLSPADMMKGLTSGATKGSGWKKALKYADIAKRKDMGGFDISSPAQMNEILFDSQTGLQKFNEAMMWGAGKADAVTWGKIWNACEWAVKGEGKLEAGSEEFYERASELFAEVIDQSQVVDGVLQRSQMMRSSNALAKQATAFMGEPTMALNMLMRAYDGLRNEQDSKKRGAAIKTFGRAATVLLITNVVNAFAQSLVDGMRSDDDDEDYWERVMAAFTGLSGEEESLWEKATAAVLSGNVGEGLNPVGYVPFAKDLLSILQGYNVTRADADIMADIVSAWQTFADSMWGDGKKTKANATWNLTKQVSKVFGISAGNLSRDIYGLLRTIAIETDNLAAQYELEKWIYEIGNEGNSNRFVDLLFKAYQDDPVVYDRIYSDMVARGVDMDKIKNRMETNMKEDQGVTKVGDLEQRYLHPDQQTQWDSKMATIQNSSLWQAATDEQRDDLETDLYNLTVQNSTGIELSEKIADGKNFGLDETEYLLYRLALDVVDTPNKSGELGGSPTNAEKAAAIGRMPGLGDGEIAYLWDTKDGYEAYTSGVDMRTYVEKIGSGASVSVEKLVGARDVGMSDEDYYDFLDALDKFDEPTESGKYGTFTQDETEAAIASIPGLSREQRAYLWQSVNKGWKSKNNPWR